MSAFFEIINLWKSDTQQIFRDFHTAEAVRANHHDGLIQRNFGITLWNTVHGDMDCAGNMPHHPFFRFTHIDQRVIARLEVFAVSLDADAAEVAFGWR